jgi:L-alanine-DL-glutamate epimerase-like enolase superfamily enzyme
MKITKITPFAAEYGQTSKSKLGSKWIFLKMETDEGIHGWGEVGSPAAVSENFMATAIKEVSENLIG